MSMETQSDSNFDLTLEPRQSSGRGLGDIIKRRFLIVIVATAIIWAAATLIGLSRQKVYRASSLLLVAPSQQQSVINQIATPADTWYEIQSEVPIHLELIRRPEIANKVRQDLKLHLPVSYLLAHVNCERLPGAADANLLLLSFDDTNPQRAQQIVNTWGAAYVSDVKNRGVASISAALTYVGSQLTLVGGQLSQIEGRLAGQEVEQQHGGVSEASLSALIQLKGSLADNETEQAAVNAELQQLNQLIGNERKHIAAGTPGAGVASIKTTRQTASAAPGSHGPGIGPHRRRPALKGTPEASLELVPTSTSDNMFGDTGTATPAGQSSGQETPPTYGPPRTYGRPSAETGTQSGSQPTITVPPSDLVQTLGQELAQLRTRRQQMVERYYEDSPQVKALDAQIRDLQKRYNQAIGASRVLSLQNARIPIQGRLASLEARASVLRSQIADAEQKVGLLPSAKMSLDELQRERAVLDQVNSMLLSKQYELRVDKAMTSPNIQVVETADLPSSPVAPKVQTLSGVGLVLGLLIGLTLAIVIDQIEDTFGDVDEIQPYTHAQVLGQIARMPNHAAPGPALMDDARSAFSRSVQMLASMLRMEMERRKISSVLLTSAGGRVGKTTIAASLACAMAAGGERVLIVDADLHKRHLRRWFGLGDEDVGLTTVLTGRATLEEAIIDTSVSGLRLLPAGPSPPTPADLLGMDRAKEIIGTINSSADIVIWDTPPAAFLPDAAVLAQQVGGVLYVIGKRDRRRMVRQALTSLRMVGAGLLGVVANGVRPPGGYRYYYYYYYYPYPNSKRSKKDE